MTLNDSYALALPERLPDRSSSPPPSGKMLSIPALTSVCLDAIFSNCSQAELLRYRGVCQQWKAVIDALFARTHVIKLFVSPLEYKRFNVAMKVRYFEVGGYYLYQYQLKAAFILRENANIQQVVEILPKLFPNIRRLMFQRCTAIYSNGIARLIRNCPDLGEICLAYMPDNDNIDPDLWSSLNTASQLRSIMFHNLYQTVIPNELTLLKRIECFHIAHYRRSLVPILSELGPRCWRIFLTWVYLTSDELKCVLLNNPVLAECVTSLRLEYIASYENREDNYKALIETFVTYFKSIEHLDICYGDHLDFSFLMPKLHCLPHLSQLFLYFGNGQIPRLDQLVEIQPLTTLKSLVVESYKLSGEELHFWISFMFPNLEQLNIHSEPPDWHVDAEAIKERFFVSLTNLKHFNLRVG